VDPFPTVNVVDRASVSIARELARAGARAAGLTEEGTERLALAVSELAQNQVDHARDGKIAVRAIVRDGVPGVEVVASDRGPGLADPAGAVDGRFRPSSRPVDGPGLGVGLGAVRRMVEELDLHVRIGEGTTVVARRFAGPVSRQPEVATVGRGVEKPSGDVAVVHRTDARLVVAALDGSGHGALARDVADLAALVTDRSPTEMVAAMDEALRGSRGAAATIAVVDRSRKVTLLGVGNVSALVVGPEGVHRYLPQAGVLGRRHRPPSGEKVLALPPHACLLLFTDGVESEVELAGLVGRSAISVAQQVLTAHGKAHDDALVLVAR
jgi:anti-sigma regulatory factor (Ser/Thr protein kinase)